MTKIWKIDLNTTLAASHVFDAVLADFCTATSAFAVEEDSNDWIVTGYSTTLPERAVLQTALEIAAQAHCYALPTLEINLLEDRDWVAENQRNFPPLRIGRFFIHGTHYKDIIPHAFVLTIDAATAFGTGEHATTQGCLLALTDLCKRHRFDLALDVGCGTGVLAMGLLRLQPAARVIASDIDPESVRVTRINARMNALNRQLTALTATGYRHRHITARRPYPLIIANILARPLCLLAKDLRQHLVPGGYSIASGLLVRQERQVISAYRKQGLILVRRYRIGNWSTLVFMG